MKINPDKIVAALKSHPNLSALAARCDLNRATLHRIISGESSPTLRTLGRIAAALAPQKQVSGRSASDKLSALNGASLQHPACMSVRRATEDEK